jgi:hypothetical protein
MVAVIKLYSSNNPARVPGKAEKDESSGKLIVKDGEKVSAEFSTGSVEYWFNTEDH